MMTMNPNLYPPDGYTFVEPDGTRFRGESWADLIRRVTAYRMANNRDASKTEEDIFNQVCNNNPGYCFDKEANRTIVYPTHSPMSHNQRVLAWLAWMIGETRTNSIPRVDSDTAAARARICAQCPMQRAMLASCDACMTASARARQGILKETSEHTSLHPCAVTGEDCQTSVYFDLPRLSNPDLPPSCWRL